MLSTTIETYYTQGCGRCALSGTPECKALPQIPVLQAFRNWIQHYTALQEEMKWGSPCYTYKGKNILIFASLKEYAALSFLKGAGLTDPQHLLLYPGENSRYTRYFPLVDTKSISLHHNQLLQWIEEGIAIETGVMSWSPDERLPDYPPELLEAFQQDPSLQKAFQTLTPGRQRGYILYFNSAKQSATRRTRIEKLKPKIIAGKGYQE
ncbi:MAG: YdeI/OmpD-associated family protein [Cytophagaceae bacterium]|nr:YdeI/OmpD-associated family protein [Cytophagaceae bacterium]